MNDILRMREICKAHKSCYECPFHVYDECLICIPPANLSDEQLYLIGKALEGEECQLVRSVKEATDEELKEVVKGEFHCGIKESGFHAYNCNDCANKCDVYYQWDKEMKKDGNDDWT